MNLDEISISRVKSALQCLIRGGMAKSDNARGVSRKEKQSPEKERKKSRLQE